jgi:hypothetical protein
VTRRMTCRTTSMSMLIVRVLKWRRWIVPLVETILAAKSCDKAFCPVSCNQGCPRTRKHRYDKEVIP